MDDEKGSQSWNIPCPGCRRALALALTAEEVAALAHDRAGVVQAHQPDLDADAAAIARWNAPHARRCRYRVTGLACGEAE